MCSPLGWFLAFGGGGAAGVLIGGLLVFGLMRFMAAGNSVEGGAKTPFME